MFQVGTELYCGTLYITCNSHIDGESSTKLLIRAFNFLLVTAWRRENGFHSTGRKSFRCTVERAQLLPLICKCYPSAGKRHIQPNQDKRPVAILASDGRLGPIHVVDRVLDSNEDGTVVVMRHRSLIKRR